MFSTKQRARIVCANFTDDLDKAKYIDTITKYNTFRKTGNYYRFSTLKALFVRYFFLLFRNVYIICDCLSPDLLFPDLKNKKINAVEGAVEVAASNLLTLCHLLSRSKLIPWYYGDYVIPTTVVKG